ncbi:MAG: TrkA family potassium uptake protein [Lachnospiraceae bacterium]|nr:TrkA family potassium uptake protein [Lachnospiraceae bacterium]
MKQILIIGLGRFGLHIAKKLQEVHIQVLGVDSNEERGKVALPYVTNAEIGDATNQKFLGSLGVANFDVCIVAIGNDFLASLETTSYLKELGAKKVVARAARDHEENFLLRNGADAVVYPEKSMGNLTAIQWSSENVLDYIQVSKDFAVFEIEMPKDWAGKSIGEIDVRKNFKVNIIAVKSKDAVNVSLDSDYRFSEGESLYIIGKDKDIQRYFHTL